MSDVLNKTVTDGIRIRAVEDPLGQYVVGFGVAPNKLRGETFPLTATPARADFNLRVLHSLALDGEGRYLTAIRSSYTLFLAADGAPVITYDYVRTPPNQYPEAHIHIDGEAPGLQSLLVASGRPKSRPAALHLPVGGRRFRPCLEDLIEFCVLERLVTPRPDWQTHLNASRENYRRQQLRAAVRREASEAADVLMREGWSVQPPEDDASS